MDKETALSELKALCAVISEGDGSVPERYVLPWRGDKGSAFCVVAPKSIEEIQSLISFAVLNGFRILPQGERTGLIGASVPNLDDSENTIVLSMERFRSRLEYSPADRRVIVDAGYTLDEVNEFLKTYGVHIPINVSSNPMIGGAIATNIGGSRVVRFGDARKLMMGIEVVMADEKRSVYSTLDRPRKDNSSINFSGVFCGSFGSLGVITAVSIETFPIFTSTYTSWVALKEDSNISDVIKTIEERSGDLLLACEFVSKEAVEIIAAFPELKYPLPLAEENSDLIFIEWGTTHEEISVEDFAEGFLSDFSLRNDVVDVAIVMPEITWSLRHQFSDALRKIGKLIGNDVSVSRDKVAELRVLVARAIKEFDSNLVIRDFGHLSDGGLHINVIVEDKDELESWTNEKSMQIRKIVGEQAVGLGGSFSAEHGLGSFNTELYANLTPNSTKALSQSFKKICDPHNVFGHSGIVLGDEGEL